MSDENSVSASDFALNHIELLTQLTIAWLVNPNTRVSAEEVPNFLQKMYSAVKSLSAAPAASQEETAPASEHTPAVTVRRSLSSKDHIISMIDGKPYKMLKRHLSINGLTPQQYRERYGLKPDYPMVSETYAAMRRDLANKIGLGRKPGAKVAPKTSAKIPANASGKPGAPKAPRQPRQPLKPRYATNPA